jgi:hypothetical protein
VSGVTVDIFVLDETMDILLVLKASVRTLKWYWGSVNMK